MSHSPSPHGQEPSAGSAISTGFQPEQYESYADNAPLTNIARSLWGVLDNFHAVSEGSLPAASEYSHAFILSVSDQTHQLTRIETFQRDLPGLSRFDDDAWRREGFRRVVGNERADLLADRVEIVAEADPRHDSQTELAEAFTGDSYMDMMLPETDARKKSIVASRQQLIDLRKAIRLDAAMAVSVDPDMKAAFTGFEAEFNAMLAGTTDSVESTVDVSWVLAYYLKSNIDMFTREVEWIEASRAEKPPEEPTADPRE